MKNKNFSIIFPNLKIEHFISIMLKFQLSYIFYVPLLVSTTLETHAILWDIYHGKFTFIRVEKQESADNLQSTFITARAAKHFYRQKKKFSLIDLCFHEYCDPSLWTVFIWSNALWLELTRKNLEFFEKLPYIIN